MRDLDVTGQEAVRVMADRGVSATYICSAFGISLRQLRMIVNRGPATIERCHKPNRDDAGLYLTEPKDDSRDEEFCARVMQLGGLPRATITPLGTVWVGPDDKPWREVKAPKSKSVLGWLGSRPLSTVGEG